MLEIWDPMQLTKGKKLLMSLFYNCFQNCYCDIIKNNGDGKSTREIDYITSK
jgi:hypothetical protein